MAKTSSSLQGSGKSLDMVNQLATEENIDSIAKILDILKEKIGEEKLSREMRNQLKQDLGVDEETANGWQKTADVLKYVDLCELVRTNPELINHLVKGVVSVLSNIFPVLAFLKFIPASVVTKTIEWSTFLTPEHILHLIANNQAEKKQQRQKENERIKAEQFFTTDEERLLIVVYQDELLFEQLRGLVEAEDDNESVVGTADHSVKVVSWTDKMWKNNYMDSRLNNAKILFIGTMKDTEGTVAKFDKCGVSYGWMGNMAFIRADEKALNHKKDYEQFLEELQSLSIPQKVRGKEKIKTKTKVWTTVAASLLLGPIGTVSTLVGAKAIDKKTLTQQMLLYGIVNLYNNDLETFMNS